MRKIFAIAALIAGTLVMVSCGDDDETITGGEETPTFDDPTVTAGNVSDVANGGTGTVSFTVVVDSDITEESDWTIASTGDITAAVGGATSGTLATGNQTVTVDITAGTTAAGATVTLTVTDSTGSSANATAAFNVLEPGDNVITMVVAEEDADNLLISDGDGITLSDFSIDAADGLASLTLAINGGAAIDLLAAAGVTDGADAAIATGATTVTGLFIPGDVISEDYEVGDDNSFVFTASDADGDDATGTIGVDIGEGVESYTSVESTDLQGNDAREVLGKIETDVTWDADSVYILTGRLIVGNGGSLTIPAGTIVKGETGSGVNAKAIIVAVGGQIFINGTSDEPVIMTGIQDGISPGEIVGTLAPDVNSLWGGLIVLGDAPIAASDTQVQIEGIPTSVLEGLYGGEDEEDNSGSITYLSLRHGGSNIGAGNEINGITFGGVGSGTTVNHVEVVANQDDGIEWFGGRVNVTNAVIWNSGDDSMDSDQDWQGSMDNFYIVTPSGSAFELDGPEPSGTAPADNGFHTFTNGTVYAGDDIDFLVDWDDATNAEVNNMYFFGISENYYPFLDDDDDEVNGVESFTGDGSGTTDNWEFTLSGEDTILEVTGLEEADITGLTLTTVDTNNNSVGFNNSTAFNWTFAYNSGELPADVNIGLDVF